MIDISKFSAEQREILSDAICYVTDSRVFTLIANDSYTPAQMKELLMCVLNGTAIYLSEPRELPDGVLEQEQESDYLRVKELAETFSYSNEKQDRSSVTAKLYQFSQEAGGSFYRKIISSIIIC